MLTHWCQLVPNCQPTLSITWRKSCAVAWRELRNCVKVEVAVPGSRVPNNMPYSSCGRNQHENGTLSELMSCVKKVEWDVLGSPVPNKPYGSCGRKVTLKRNTWRRDIDLASSPWVFHQCATSGSQGWVRFEVAFHSVCVCVCRTVMSSVCGGPEPSRSLSSLHWESEGHDLDSAPNSLPFPSDPCAVLPTAALIPHSSTAAPL